MKYMKYKMAVFDLDGTLLNTLEDLADAVNYSLAQFGMPQRTIEEVRNYVGNGIRLLIERSVPNGTDLPVIDNVFECFKKYYQEHCNDKTKAYDGIIDMLKELKQSGIKLAVLSSKDSKPRSPEAPRSNGSTSISCSPSFCAGPSAACCSSSCNG